ncbi:MAG: hypothetical protein WC340_09445 [Kiritimatiellia bacterium]
MTKAVSITTFLVFMLFAQADVTWTGSANDGNRWSTPGNWSPNAAPTAADKAIFNVASATTVLIDQPGCICSQIEINANSKALTFSGTDTLEIRKIGGYNALNNNRANYATTFDCPVNMTLDGTLTTDGKFYFYPGCVYNSDVTCAARLIYFSNATAGAGLGKTVFRGNFTCTCTHANGVYFYPQSLNNEIYIDIADPGKEFQINNCKKVLFSNGAMTFKQGRASLAVVSGSGNFVIDGGTVTANVGITGDIAENMNFISGVLNNSKTFANGVDDLPGALGFTDGTLGSNCVTHHLGSGNPIMTLFNAGQREVLTVDGLLTATNSGAYVRICSDAGGNSSFRGSGEVMMYKYSFNNTSATRPFTFRDVTVTVGAGGFNAESYNQAVRFDGATLRAFGENWSGFATKSGIAFFSGHAKVDTDDAIANGTPRTISLNSVVLENGLDLSVVGGGMATFILDSNYKFDFSSLTIGTNTSFEMVSSVSSFADKLTLHDGARLILPAVRTGALDINEYELDGAATIEVKIAAGTTQPLFRVISGDRLSAENLTVELNDLSGEGYLYDIVDGNLYVYIAFSPVVGAAEWTGSGDGASWSDASNWMKTPETADSVYFSGFSNLNVNADISGGSFKQLFFRDTAAAFTISGNPIELTSALSGDNAAVYSAANVPVTISNDLSITTSLTALVGDGASCPVTLAGTVTGPNGLLSLDGVFTFTGTATFPNLSFMLGHGESRLIVGDGGSVYLTQSPSLRSGAVIVMAGGLLELPVTCAGWNWFYDGGGHIVDGTLKIAGGFGTELAAQNFTGTGRIDIGYATIPGVNSWTNVISGITFNVSNAWHTTVSGKENCTATLSMTGGRLGAKGDWTYGVAPDANAAEVTSTPGGRALELRGTVIIDTEDPDTAAAHMITFTDPIDGSAGALVKEGAGALVISADTMSVTNNFIGGLTLTGGTLLLNGPVTNVRAGGIVFAGGGISASKTWRASLNGWTTLIAASSVTGDPVDPSGKLKFRVVDGTDGEMLVQAKSAGNGFLILIR